MFGLTKGGKKSLEQAKKFGLAKYYDEHMGHYLIPQDEVTPEIMSKVMGLVWHGKAYKQNGEVNDEDEIAMSIETAVDWENTGELIEGKYELFIREVEKFH